MPDSASGHPPDDAGPSATVPAGEATSSTQPGTAAPPGSQPGGPAAAQTGGPAGTRTGGLASAQPGAERPEGQAAQPGGTGAPEDQPSRPAVGQGPPLALTVVAVLLTAGSGATDVACFTRLGSVFASVMTSNIVFLGLSAAQHSANLAEHAVIALAAYTAGVTVASQVAGIRQRRPGRRGAGGPDGAAGRAGGTHWSPGIAATLVTEAVLLAAFTIGWQVTGAKPEGGAQLFLLAVAAMAMGLQSGVVAVMGIAGVSTTYLTGTLTALISAVASPGSGQGNNNGRRLAALCALVAGAGLSGLLLATVQAAVPAIPLVVLVAVLVVGAIWLRPAARSSAAERPGPPA